MQSIAEHRHASGVDPIRHSSVQPWSAGEIFPAVIAVVERYSRPPDRAVWVDVYHGQYERYVENFYKQPLAARLLSVSYELTLGSFTEEYATREDAEEVARFMLGRAAPVKYPEGPRPQRRGWPEK